ncbi:MAG: DNA-binding transcriptional regulator CueR [Methanomassiliicoccales archaeon PtaU1.Bin124]|nr:MAG: DNA-binding transcriptional regulator CueR [Methanomassiliicoccales archaeon PtaU1.Bin124]
MPVADNGELMTIGAFSMMTRLTQRALRLYEEKGLLLPVRKEITGYRWYAYSQINKGIRLKILADLGFGLHSMREAMDAFDRGDADRLVELENERRAEIDRNVDGLLTVRRQLEGNALLEVLNMKEQEPVEKMLPEMRVVSIRTKGKYSEVIPQSIGRICQSLIKQSQVRMCGSPLVIYHDEEYKENDADVEIAVPVTGKVTVEAEMEVKTLPATKVLSIVHKGPYHLVTHAWGKAGQYAKQHGYKVLGQCREVYLNDPSEVGPAEYLTEVQLRVE